MKALSAAPSQQETKTKGQTSEMNGERLEISFTDNCSGIAQDALPYVLDPFFTTKDPDKGMGLGLSVSHGIISSMGGEISASNTPNGASFVISVPLSID